MTLTRRHVPSQGGGESQPPVPGGVGRGVSLGAPVRASQCHPAHSRPDDRPVPPEPSGGRQLCRPLSAPRSVSRTRHTNPPPGQTGAPGMQTNSQQGPTRERSLPLLAAARPVGRPQLSAVCNTAAGCRAEMDHALFGILHLRKVLCAKFATLYAEYH